MADESDPVSFLQQKLSVALPRNTEVMTVSLRGEDRDGVRNIVRAVVEAYLNEDFDRVRRREQLTRLETIYAERENAIRNKRAQLQGLAGQLGSGESQVLTTKQQMMLQHLGEVRRELLLVQSEKRKIEGEMKGLSVLTQGGPEDSGLHVSQTEFLAALNSDPGYNDMRKSLMQSNVDKVLTQSVAGSALAQRYTRMNDDVDKALETQIKAHFNEVRERLQASARDKAQGDMKRLNAQIEHVVAQEKQLQDRVDVLTKEANEVGNLSIDVIVTRDELKQLEEVRNLVGKEIEQLKVELNASRISLIQPADVPAVPSQTVRKALTAAAVLFGFFMPVGLIVWWDVSARRINSSDDVRRELGLDIFGVVPLVPTRAVRHMALPDHRHSNWRSLVCESADGIAARLLHVAEYDRTQVIMVSSAVGGEGKTVLSTQLAMSLARTGRRTLLVDFDLRRPSIEKVFKLPLHPGVSEVLRAEVDFRQAIQETPTQNLSVMTAGSWSPKLLAMLASGLTDSLFTSLRGEYDFVIIDVCPILPVADARFIAQHVDGVILSVLRDTSRAPKIRAACNILGALGVRILGAVVAEAGANGDYSDRRYQAWHTVTAKTVSET